MYWLKILLLSSSLKYFICGVDPGTGFPYDNIKITNNQIASHSSYTSPTNIGVYLVLLTKYHNDDKLKQCLKSLLNTKSYYGMYPWLSVDGTKDYPYQNVISCVDNSNLFAGIIKVLDYAVTIKDQEMYIMANVLLFKAQEGYRYLYDNFRGLLRGGFETDGKYLEYYIDRYGTESRICTYVYDYLFNTNITSKLPHVWRDNRIVSTNGSLFQAVFPALLWQENETAKLYEYFFTDDYLYYTKIRDNFPSPAMITQEIYGGSLGVEEMSEFPKKLEMRTVIVPYAISLVYLNNSAKAMQLFLQLISKYPSIITEYGVCDSVTDSEVVYSVLALDNAIIILSLDKDL